MIDKAIPQGQDGHLDHSQEAWLRLMPDGWDGTDIVAENAKLKELCADMWGSGHIDRSCAECDIRAECDTEIEEAHKNGKGRSCARCLFERRIEQRMKL